MPFNTNQVLTGATMPVITDPNGNKIFHTSVNVDERLYREAKKARIPLSYTLEEALRQKLGYSIIGNAGAIVE